MGNIGNVLFRYGGQRNGTISLWQVDSQEQRGVAYRYYTEHAYAHPGPIGTGVRAACVWSQCEVSRCINISGR